MSLAAVPSPPNRTKPRTYEEFVRDIYNDKRANHEARERLLAVAYAVYPTEPEAGVSPLREARRVLGRNPIDTRRCGDPAAAAASRSNATSHAADRDPHGR